MYFPDERPSEKKEDLSMNEMMKRFRERRKEMWENHITEMVKTGEVKKPKVKVVPRPPGK